MSETDIVERLLGLQRVSQFNSAGVIEHYDATPTPLDQEAAAEITRLRTALAEMKERAARVADNYEHPLSTMASKAARDIAAAIRALPDEGEGWRTIDSAPREGDIMLYSVDRSDLYIGCWDDFDEVNNPRFSHWRPLPPPPGGER